MDVVWIKLTGETGTVESNMFGTGGVVKMVQGDEYTYLYSSSVIVGVVQESVDEILGLIGSVRNGVKVGETKEV